MVSISVYMELNPHPLFNGLERNSDRRVQTTLPQRCNLAERSPREPFRDIFHWLGVSLAPRNPEIAR